MAFSRTSSIEYHLNAEVSAYEQPLVTFNLPSELPTLQSAVSDNLDILSPGFYTPPELSDFVTPLSSPRARLNYAVEALNALQMERRQKRTFHQMLSCVEAERQLPERQSLLPLQLLNSEKPEEVQASTPPVLYQQSTAPQEHGYPVYSETLNPVYSEEWDWSSGWNHHPLYYSNCYSQQNWSWGNFPSSSYTSHSRFEAPSKFGGGVQKATARAFYARRKMKKGVEA